MKKVFRVVKPLPIIAILGTVCVSPIALADDWRWQVRPIIGFSSLSDVNGDVTAAFNGGGDIDVDIDSGFMAGLGVGYRLGENWVAELAWEYRSNDSLASLNQSQGQTRFDGGDYASNVFHLNGIYNWPSSNKLQPYLGAGVSWVQEVDLDVTSNGEEVSFSADGDVGFQVFAGLNWVLNDQWGAQAELRYGSLTGIDLEEESSSGVIDGLDYQPLTAQLGLTYRF